MKGNNVEIQWVTEEVKNNKYEIMLIKRKLITEYYCSYIFLKRTRKVDSLRNNATLFEEVSPKVVQIGFDTAHYYNENMTLEEKRIDAINQAKDFLEMIK